MEALSPQHEDVRALADLMKTGKTAVITGAGVSTDAGLPDYRGVGTTEIPTVDYDQFVSDPVWQRWVWQRNQETWRCADALTPTPGHVALADLEATGFVTGIATQNVDGLHQKAGSRVVHELHGTYAAVTCTDCGVTLGRSDIDAQVRRLNPDVADDLDPTHVAILALAERQKAEASTFVPPPCPTCGGLLKPAVVAFGEMLPEATMRAASALARDCDVCLVVGTSLAVMTGLYVAYDALQVGAALAIINRGPTQLDARADLRIEGGASEVLTEVAALLGATGAAQAQVSG